MATVATVVPSFIVLAWITELPTLTGMSRIRPVIVERTRVELPVVLREDTPSRMTSRDSWAAAFSSVAWLKACRTWSYSSSLTSFLS